MIREIFGFDHDAVTDQGDLFHVAQEIEARPFQLAAKNTRDGGSLNCSRFKRLTDYPLVAKSREGDLIALRV